MQTNQDYLSGWEALNVAKENGVIADWHPLHFFNPNKKLKKYTYNPIFKDKGITRRYIPQLQREEYVANYPRAIADLVYHNQMQGLKNCCFDYLDEKESRELFELLKGIDTPQVQAFLKYELTKLFVEDQCKSIKKRD